MSPTSSIGAPCCWSIGTRRRTPRRLTYVLDERHWSSQYKLTFTLWLERAECEFLSSNFEEAEQIIVELLQRGASKVDQAAAYHLKVLLHIVKAEHPQAVDS